MLLRESGKAIGEDVKLEGSIGEGDSGVHHGAALIRFAEAATRGSDDLNDVRSALVAAIGSETLGSIVSPSDRCGASALRPTFGRVSRHGAMALSWSMDKVGPICRSAADAALVFAALHDGRRPHSKTNSNDCSDR